MKKKNIRNIEEYKRMAKESEQGMETCIRKYLEKCASEDPQFAAKYDAKKFKNCIQFVVDCAKEILSGKNGEVADDVCYRIARDYYNDRLWEYRESSSASDVQKEKLEPEQVEAKAEEKPVKTAVTHKKDEQISFLDMLEATHA